MIHSIGRGIQQLCTDYSSLQSANITKLIRREERTNSSGEGNHVTRSPPGNSEGDDGLEAVEPVELRREPRPRLSLALRRRDPLLLGGLLILGYRVHLMRLRLPGGGGPPRQPRGEEPGRGDVRRRWAQDGEGQDLVHGQSRTTAAADQNRQKRDRMWRSFLLLGNWTDRLLGGFWRALACSYVWCARALACLLGLLACCSASRWGF